MGWRRLVRYYRYRIIRMSSTAESIAVNMAGGSAMSFTPFFGIHIFGAMGFAWLIGMRMNIIAATVGTFVGNPWTFPFLMYTSHWIGTTIMTFFGFMGEGVDLTPDIVEKQADNIMAFIWENFYDIFLPTALGGSIMAIVTFPFYFFLYLYLVRGAQRARKLRMRRRQKALFNKKARSTTKKAKK